MQLTTLRSWNIVVDVLFLNLDISFKNRNSVTCLKKRPSRQDIYEQPR